MNSLILACEAMPLAGFLLILTAGRTEQSVAAISYWAIHILGACIIALLSVWMLAGFPSHEYLWFTAFQRGEYQFPVLFYLDRVGAAYLFCIWVIASVIIRYCRYYLHREAGYKRFFLTIFAFIFGLNVVVLAGSLDMLFAGWEVVGVASFLLIAFYRHRVQPVRNALRAYSIYRYCDLGLLLAACLSDLLLHGQNHFSALAQAFGPDANPPLDYSALFILSLFLIWAACGKSAQFPFCYWLPRAMEGPTPSSAIFYGALSVHLGVFLLLRTKPVWFYEYASRLVVFMTGAVTVFVANIAEKAQSNIKGQIAYASIAQVGLMFVELSVGLEVLVLVHFLGNAFLRCYQLLVSPSIIAHLLRVEGAADTGFDIKNRSIAKSLPLALRDTLPEVLENTLQVLALQEFNLELLVRSLLWEPLKAAGSAINQVSAWHKSFIVGAVAAVGWFGVESGSMDSGYLAIPAALGMVMASFSAFSQRRSAFKVWNGVVLSGLFAGGATWLVNPAAAGDVSLFLAGVVPAWLLGIVVMALLVKGEPLDAAPFAYRAMAEKKPVLSLLLFLSFLGVVGFPITPAFIGEDLLIFHLSSGHAWVVVLLAVSFVLNGIAAAGMFQRLCMGRPMEVQSNPTEVGKEALQPSQEVPAAASAGGG